MVSFELARILKRAAAISLLATSMLPYAGFAQLRASSSADEAIKEIIAEIEDVQAQDAARSPKLIEPLTALGLRSHEQGDYELAIAATEQARHIVRVNYGLFTLREASLLQQLARSQQARGNVQAAWDVEQDLLALIGRHPRDERVAPILQEIGSRRLDVLERYQSGEFPPEIVLGCYYGGGGDSNCHAGSRGAVKARLQDEALSYYWQAINVVVVNEGYASDELPALLMELVRLSHQYGKYLLGKRSLRYLYRYESENSQPWNALAQMADWELMYARSARYLEGFESVLEAYGQAHALLEQQGTQQSKIDEILSPYVPVVLPAFRPNPLVSEKTADSTGYIDVAFDISKHGRADGVEILATVDATRRAEKELVRLIRQSTFRPRLVNGKVADSARVTLRYYVNEPDAGAADVDTTIACTRDSGCGPAGG